MGCYPVILGLLAVYYLNDGVPSEWEAMAAAIQTFYAMIFVDFQFSIMDVSMSDFFNAADWTAWVLLLFQPCFKFSIQNTFLHGCSHRRSFQCLRPYSILKVETIELTV